MAWASLESAEVSVDSNNQAQPLDQICQENVGCCEKADSGEVHSQDRVRCVALGSLM
ncbi:hypothetical protein BDV26DRAFT_297482 [Aspergillus bertholletiae]|uniref:Uncharacterized protein n=1 Tax=Aspergillus bertholletiae TaxID=1226010 RepID=A0A5N7AVF1_9EURO|nr:hypothetical protein BDV26DRAFT_297482 [Aspergillus bertholletiae]